ncbi:MAG TPA: tetratricopeptide repeat protein [Syntrophorhabdales bacterium]|nr:tetratricopeptide repeat protein [Syntrophorhabdales bacterium]
MEKLKILTSTLAEIYIRQGHLDKAKEVYERLLSKDAENTLYKGRVTLLEHDTPDRKRLRLLTQILKRLEEQRDERETS